MKKIIFVLAIVMATTVTAEGHTYYNKRVTISFQTFYDALQPYGNWINTAKYGYVWRPYTDDPNGFRPYFTAGNWVYTDLGWNWVSDYPWGWAPFHYGRWYCDDYLGWMWIPGDEWAPAWVTWGFYNDCWAWAPLGPNIFITTAFNWYAPSYWWTFVPYRYFCTDNWYAYIRHMPVRISDITCLRNAYWGNNSRHYRDNWFYGPRVRDVERYLGSRVTRNRLVDSDRPENLVARNGRVDVFRPGVIAQSENVRPVRYRDSKSVRVEVMNQHNRGFNPDGNGRTEAVTGRINESSSRSVKINRIEPVRESVNRSSSARNGRMQRAATRIQDPDRSNYFNQTGASQRSGFNSSAGRGNSGYDVSTNRTTSRSAIGSRPGGSYSSHGGRHR